MFITILSKIKEIAVDFMTNKDITINWDMADENITYLCDI